MKQVPMISTSVFGIDKDISLRSIRIFFYFILFYFKRKLGKGEGGNFRSLKLTEKKYHELKNAKK
jgi:hypothetical protein